ncbi:MAG: NAD(P)H-hydrate dehydratase [Verrucomicrobiota bacterium]
MSIFSPEFIQALERQAFADGVSAEALMEEAGAGMAATIRQFVPTPGVCLAVFGKGHNGGDALVTARLLSEQGWRVYLIPAFPTDTLAPLTSKKWDEAGRCDTLPLSHFQSWKADPALPLIILDGLLGIGASGPLRPPISDATQAINALRENSHARVFALDLPTGLNGESGIASQDTVIADVTITVAFAKTGLLTDHAEHFVGRLALIPLHELSIRVQSHTSDELNTPHNLAPLWKHRSADCHKGDCGRVALVAGSKGTLGAAALAASGALRSGAGLVTLWIPESLYPMATIIAPVECMVRPFNHFQEILATRSDVLAIGPGLGLDHPEAVLELIRRFPGPAVIDADALTILATQLSALKQSQGPRLLTPHPGEMARLFPGSEWLSRREIAVQFTEEWPVTLLLKGMRSVICTRREPISFNTTGTPGMASGGMGDVLTGVCAGLLGQGLNTHNAARLGAWLCGRSAEALVSHGTRSNESLLASDVASHLGAAFETLRQRSS